MSEPILVVEDDGLIRMDLADTLSDAGHDVIEAGNADEAVKILSEAREVAAVLTDIDMPGSMNGIALAHLVAERWPATRIVVISGRYNPSQGSLPAKARFLTKPVTEQVLSRTMSEIGLGR